MLRFALLRAAMLVASIAGAALLAAAIAALGEPGSTTTVANFVSAMLAKAPDVLSFQAGQSSLSGVAARIAAGPAFIESLQLLLFALPIALILGIPLGWALADPKTRYLIAPFVQLIGAIPVFCGAIVISLLFARLWPAQPGIDHSLFSAVAAGDREALKIAVMSITPAGVTVGLAGAGAVALAWRRALQRASNEPYREGLRRLGLTDQEILRVYVSRQAFALTLAELASILLALFAAVAVAEWIFSRPGAGAAFIHAVALEDWAVAAVITFVIAVVRAAADFAGSVAAHALLAGEKT